MVKQASNIRKRLRRFLTADPGRFAGGSAVSDPLGLLAVERERLAVLRSRSMTGVLRRPQLRTRAPGLPPKPPRSPVLDSTSIAVDVTFS
jgi:hypothetical protein